jgi:predicted branched-subunit amino acid permease
MSALAFTGSAQFAAVATYAAGGGVLAAIAVAASLNARYAAMGLSAGSAFRGKTFIRFIEGQFVVDESWGVAMQPDGRVDVARLIGAGVLLCVGWVSGTVIGAAGASSLPPPEDLGLDAAFPALFLALVAPQLGGPTARWAALLAAAATLALTPLLPPGLPVLGAAAACLIGAVRRG